MRLHSFFYRYSNEYDTNWKLKRLVNQVWWNMFISFTGWNHWQHCMNNKLNTFTKWYVWLFYLLFIQSHLNRSIYYWLNDTRYTWPKYWTINLINCFREWFLSMHSVDTNWYSLVQLIHKYVLCYTLALGDIFSVRFVVIFWYWTKLTKACLHRGFTFIYKSCFQPQVKGSICCFYAQITLFNLYFWYYFNFIYDNVKHSSCGQNP